MKPRVALQIYSLRTEVARDFAGTFKAVGAMGYPAVQMAWFANQPPSTADLKKLLDDCGLAVAGCHILLEDLERNLEFEVERALQLNTPDVLIPAINAERRKSRSDYHRIADIANALGERCKKLGARLHYHNHAFEFEKFDGEYALDILMNGTDPALVKFEPDVYWIRVGGEDPSKIIAKYAGRCPMIHLKDMTVGANPTYAEVGEGIIDFHPIFAASEAQNAEWYVVEQDWCARPPLDAVAISLKHLKAWGKL